MYKSLVVTAGALSSLIIVPTPCASAEVAGLSRMDRLTKNVSFGSKEVSPTIGTEICIVALPTPGGNKSKPEVVVKSTFAVAPFGGTPLAVV